MILSFPLLFTSRHVCEACLSSRLSLHVLPGDDHLQLLFSDFCPTHISLVEDRPGEVSLLHIRTNQSSLSEISSLHIRIATG